MAKRNSTEEKLKSRCEILEKVVISVSDIYSDTNTNEDQKRLIETIIGAAIWYLPHSDKYWTGMISKKAIKALENNNNAKLTKEHQFPRKIAAKELLMDITQLKQVGSLHKLYEEKYAKFNYVTPEENRSISKHQRDDVFKDIETAYGKANIELDEFDKSALANLRKKRNT